MTNSAILSTPAGMLEIHAEGDAITRVNFIRSGNPTPAPSHPILQQACLQLQEYFAGKRTHFTLPLNPEGTEFQRQVWHALQQIPHGQTRSYADIAAAIGNPKAVRAVGQANNRNPIGIIIPCHRVIGADGTLTGYAGGLEAKQWLLEHESTATARRAA